MMLYCIKKNMGASGVGVQVRRAHKPFSIKKQT